MSELKSINKEDVISALRYVKDGDKNVVELGMVSSVVVRGDNVGFALEVNINDVSEKEALRLECEQAIKTIDGVKSVTAVITSNEDGSIQAPSPRNAPAIKAKSEITRTNIEGVRNIIVVAAGKGGVGKSTVAVNLARSLVKQGKKVGIVDVDIYGPSIPTMLGLSGNVGASPDGKMLPKEKDGLKSLSIGYLVDDKKAVIWRSSMALKGMNQLLLGTFWGNLDYLIVDTPPGTGDIQLTLLKNYNISGIVLVSTPQKVALLDVVKSAEMFKKLHVPILGIVENMSYFEDDSGKKNYVFGTGNVAEFAKNSNIEFLGEIPIIPKIAEFADKGKDLVAFSAIDSITSIINKKMESK